jgi:hypothetical protein
MINVNGGTFTYNSAIRVIHISSEKGGVLAIFWRELFSVNLAPKLRFFKRVKNLDKMVIFAP